MYAYVHWDVLVRFLRSVGYKVKWVMNITDVGHLTSDEDTGEDKMEKGAKREGLTVWQIAEKYMQQFLESVDLLNIKRPDVLSKATKHIEDQIELIKKIEANGFTYKTSTGLIFDTSKFKDYAAFANLNLKKQQSGARVDVDPEKKRPWDFLLWVTNQPEHIMKWESPWGTGFPGWHIECTAMSTKYLGNRFDIHTGGKEHIPVHHTNEVAQAFGAFGRQTVNYWLHNEWMTLKGEKISKSSGNMITVEDIKKEGYDPLALRYLILNSQYRRGMDFTWDALASAQVALSKIKEHMQTFRADSSRTMLSQEKDQKRVSFLTKFTNVLADDLNTPQALAVLWEVVKSNIPSEDKYDLIVTFDEVLGLKLTMPEAQLPPDVLELSHKRDLSRQKNDYEDADRLRNEIQSKGYIVKDTSEGTLIILKDAK